MAALLTTLGAAHLVELDAGTSPTTNAFDGIVFGTGNDTPAVGDTQAQIQPIITTVTRPVESGYPKQAENDPRNPVADATWWTWKFILPSGQAFVASNVALTNYSGAVFSDTTPLGIHSYDATAPVDNLFDQRLIVWFNAKTGETPTLVTFPEQALENRVTRVVGFAARNRALGSYPNGSVIDHTKVKTRPQLNQYVWTGAQVAGPSGTTLRADKVSSFVLQIEEWDSNEREYIVTDEEGVDITANVYSVDQYNDQRWNGQGGFNVSHVWEPPYMTEEGTWRLSYRMELSDGDVREWVNEVEFRRGGP